MAPLTTSRTRIGTPPSRDQLFRTADHPDDRRARRVKTGRTEQFNVRVRAGFKHRVEQHAAAEKETLGSMVEALLAAYEAGARPPEHGPTIAETRAGRHKLVRFWATPEVFIAIGKVAAVRKLTVSTLIEDLLAREVTRLDPHGGKFDVAVKR